MIARFPMFLHESTKQLCLVVIVSLKNTVGLAKGHHNAQGGYRIKENSSAT
jgi:hypothetical protein